MTNKTFHQRFATQTSSAAVKSDLFLALYPGVCNKCHSVHGSFLGIPAGLQMEHILSALTTALRRLRETLVIFNNNGIVSGQRYIYI